MRVATIVAAAGSGTRLGRPKQFLELAPDERLVDRAVATARATSDWVGVVLPAGCSWDGADVDGVATGGGSRYESVAAGVALVPTGAEIVVVHSASHPLASAALVEELIAAVDAGADGAVPFLEAVDVVKRRADDGSLATVGRADLGSAQCPMAFGRAILDRAFAAGIEAIEESALVEGIGGRVVAVAGEVANVHVVDEASLAVARALA